MLSSRRIHPYKENICTPDPNDEFNSTKELKRLELLVDCVCGYAVWCVCVCMRVVEREGKVEKDKYRRETMQSEVIETCIGLVIYKAPHKQSQEREREEREGSLMQ